MPINAASVNSTTPPADLAVINNKSSEYASMTPDLLLAMCSRKLKDMNKQLHDLYTTQTGSSDFSSKMSQLLAQFQGNPKLGTDGGKAAFTLDSNGQPVKDSQGYYDGPAGDIQKGFDAAINACQDPDVKQQLIEARNNFNATAADGQIDAGEMSKFSTQITDLQQASSSNDQLRLSQMKVVADDISTLITSTSNLLSSMQQSTMTEAQNLKG